MSLLLHTAIRLAEKTPHTDSKGITTHSWIWPEASELIYGTISSVVVFYLLYKFGLPPARKAMAQRTERIQKELDAAAAAKSAAEAEAAEIRRAKGDIEGERARLLADADLQAEQLLADGRQRLATEIAEMHARAEIEIAQLATRSGDELRAEISRLSIAATEKLVAEHLDDATRNDLVEAFIAKVGAS